MTRSRPPLTVHASPVVHYIDTGDRVRFWFLPWQGYFKEVTQAEWQAQYLPAFALIDIPIVEQDAVDA